MPKKPAPAAPTIADLTPDPANRRTHPERNLGMLVDALHKVGASRSIVIDENNVILAGNGIVSAASEAGLSRLQIVEADGDTLVAVRRRGLTTDQKRDLALYDNRTAELAEWNAAQLAADLHDGADLSAFFLDGELARLGVLGEGVDDPQREWTGLPEFHQDALGLGFHRLVVHFKDQAAMEWFAALVGQPVGKNVRYIWIPAQVDEVFRDKEYRDAEPAP